MATRAEIKLKARQRADMERSTFVSDAELNTYVQDSYGELYDLLVSAYEDYYITELPFTIASGSSFAVPSNFYKLRGVDIVSGGSRPVSLRPFNFAERNTANSSRLRANSGRQYRLTGANLMILPTDSAAGDYVMWYVPRVTVLTADGDQLVGILDFDDYVAVDVAVKMLVKEESDPSALLMTKSALIKRVQDMAQNRDAGSPQTIADVTSDRFDDTEYSR